MPSSIFDQVISAQRKFDEEVRQENPLMGEDDQLKINWTKQLLLGIVSESNEVLEQISWKVHTQTDNRIEQHNIHREIVDLFKYALSLANLWELDGQTLLQLALDKTEEMTIKRQMAKWRPQRDILLVDMDGTIADWRRSFINWLVDRGVSGMEIDPASSLSIEEDLGLKYDEYLRLKTAFESGGGYRKLVPIPTGLEYVKNKARTCDIVVFTARPNKEFRSIWWDSYQWLLEHGITPNLLKIGHEERIEYALWVKSLGLNVTLFDDNPTLALRAANSGIDVMLSPTPYNSNLVHPLIRRFHVTTY